MLAAFLARHRAEMRADFQQYYGMDIGLIGITVRPTHAADLAEMLPAGSRTFRAEAPELAWGTVEYLLADCVDALNVLAWQQTKDGAKNKNRPKPVKRPKQPKKQKAGYTVEEYEAILNKPRKEVGHGN
jgi:hypothetical protein